MRPTVQTYTLDFNELYQSPGMITIDIPNTPYRVYVAFLREDTGFFVDIWIDRA